MAFSWISRWRWFFLVTLVGFVFPFAYVDWTGKIVDVDGLGPSFSIRTPPFGFGPYRLEFIIRSNGILETTPSGTGPFDDITISLQAGSTSDFSPHMHCERNQEIMACRANQSIFLLPWRRDSFSVTIAHADASVHLVLVRPSYPGTSVFLWVTGVLFALFALAILLGIRFLTRLITRRTKPALTDSDTSTS